MTAPMHIPAVLHGEGIKAMCLLDVWQENSSTGRVFTRCRIHDAPPDLPDGAYKLEFRANTVATRKTFGTWELAFLPPKIRLDGPT